MPDQELTPSPVQPHELVAAARGNTQLTDFMLELGAIALAKAIEYFNIGRMSPEEGLAFNEKQLTDLDQLIRDSRARIAAQGESTG